MADAGDGCLTDWAGRLAHSFRDRTGRLPDGVWAAPGRINLIGEHTDHSEGFVLPIAVDRHAMAAAALRDDGRLRCWSLQESSVAEAAVAELRPGRFQGWAAYPLGAAWALTQAGVTVPGADVVVDSDVPMGAGLSSSAALEVAVTVALTELAGGDRGAPTVDRLDLARAAQRAERDFVGLPCGIMDQLASVAGRAGCALLIDTRSLTVEPIPLGLEAAGLRLVAIDTGVRRRLVEAPYADRQEACRVAARVLGVAALRDVTPARVDAATARLGDPGYRRARHVVTENARVLRVVEVLRAGRVGDIGDLLSESHASLRDDFEVSCPELDLAVTTAIAAGAAGARLTGAGFGGCALALVPTGAMTEVAGALRRVFAGQGLAPPTTFEVTPVDGARRV